MGSVKGFADRSINIISILQFYCRFLMPQFAVRKDRVEKVSFVAYYILANTCRKYFIIMTKFMQEPRFKAVFCVPFVLRQLFSNETN